MTSVARAPLLALALAGCGADPDPCAGIEGTCVALEVSSPAIEQIDQLELDVLFGDTHGTTTTTPGSGAVALPIVTAIAIALPDDAPQPVGVVAAGKLGGAVLGTGAAAREVAPGARETLAIVLAPPEACVPGAFYCGGDKLAGDPDTLYQCNGGGVPLARGRCPLGCVVRPGDDDACRGGGGCVEGGDYCGGDKVDGDPQTLYTCRDGAASNPRPCAGGCVINPGDDDSCR